MQHEPEAIPKQWAAIFELFRQKKIKGVVFDKVYTWVFPLTLSKSGLANTDRE